MQKALSGDAATFVCRSRSKDLALKSAEADIIIAALDNPTSFKAEMVKEGAVVIDGKFYPRTDASKNRTFKLTGDVKFDEVAPKCSLHHPLFRRNVLIINRLSDRKEYSAGRQESNLSIILCPRFLFFCLRRETEAEGGTHSSERRTLIPVV